MGGYSILLMLAVIAAAVIVNVIVGALPASYTVFDLTGTGAYEISDKSIEFLGTLDTDITVYFVAAEQSRNPQIDTFLKLYAEQSDHITVVYKDPDEDPKFLDDHDITSDGGTNNENCLVIESGKRSKTVYYEDIYEFSPEAIADYSENYYYYLMQGVTSIDQVYARDVFDAENELTSAIDFVTTDDLPVAYFLTGHGELSLGVFESLIEDNNIGLSELNLLTSGIPDDAGLVLINNPSSDMTESEVSLLKSYIDGGGRILLVTDVTSYSTEEMPNLTSLAAHCGLSAYDGVVLEPDGSNRFYENRFNLVETLETNDITTVIANNPSSVIVYMPRAHAIVADEEYEGTMRVTPIIKTSDAAYIIGAGESDRERGDDDETGEFWLGAMSRDSSSGAAFVWYSSAFINSDESLYYVQYNNLNVYASSILTICNKSATISVDSVYTNVNTALMMGDMTRNTLTVIILIALPISMLVAGFVIWLRRRVR